jgi:cyclopropane fatty-acyl-phospholipid synthase-like methyltransferase
MTDAGWRDMILGWATLPSLFAAWARLADGVREGRSPFELTHGHGLHAHLAGSEGERRAYGTAMASTVEGFEAFADAADLAGVDTLVSIGGGSGAELVPVLRRYGNLKAVLTDLPEALETAEATLASYGVSDRVTIEHGDARLAAPSGDAYLLSTVLRCLGDADAIAVLSAIRTAATADARLYVVEMPLSDGPPVHPQASADLTAWVAYGGADRTVDGWRDLHARAGWDMLDVRPLNMGYSLLTSR